MIFSRASEHGLNAMICVARNNENGQPVRVREIADAMGIPFPTLAKIVQKLTREGILISRKGPGGGIALGRPAGDLTLLEIVEAVEDRHLGSECILGVAGCSERTRHCPLHNQWKGIREALVEMLENQTLDKVAEETPEAGFALRDVVPKAPGRPSPKRARPQARVRRSAGN